MIETSENLPETRELPVAPFKYVRMEARGELLLIDDRVLDAPNLRDDFYCSILAYSTTCRTLVVGLGNLLYSWSERSGVKLLNSGLRDESHLTSVAFSSTEGEKAILAYGRSNRTLALISMHDCHFESEEHQRDRDFTPRFEVTLQNPVACLS